jgi:hypothetical protein
MIGAIKSIFRKLGIRRYKLESFHYRLDQVLPTRFVDVWLSKPILILRWLQNTLMRRTLLCLPEMPGEVGYEITKLAMILGIRLTRDSKHAHRGLAWKDITVRNDPYAVKQRPDFFLNSRCSNIGKDRIEEVFESVFGYALRIDPTTFRGLCVRKSVLNAKHDGVVLECPIAKAESGFVYQRLIDNSDSCEVIDLRAPVYRDKIPLVYIKRRPITTRFSDLNDAVELTRTDEVFSRDEQRLIIEFARAFQLDYGGVDILRDKANGRIYIVDVNNTPFGPPKELPRSAKRRALATLAAIFHDEFIEGAACARIEQLKRQPESVAPIESA